MAYGTGTMPYQAQYQKLAGLKIHLYLLLYYMFWSVQLSPLICKSPPLSSCIAKPCPQARFPTPDTGKLKFQLGVMEMVSKRFYDSNTPLVIKFVETNIQAMQSAVLLRSAINKLEAWGDSPAARMKKDKGDGVINTIRTTRTKFQDLCTKIKSLRDEAVEQMKLDLASEELGHSRLFAFDVAKSFVENSDLLKNEIYVDILAQKFVDFKEDVRKVKESLEPLCQNMHLKGSNFWKANLGSTDSLEEVCSQAGKTIELLRGQDLRTECLNFSQATLLDEQV